jgi:hypothetical protein
MRSKIHLIGMVLLLLIIVIFVLILHPTTSHPPQSVKGGAQTPGITSPPSPSAYPANIDLEPLDSYGTYNPDALNNPNLGAVDINMNWVDVEPQQGVFNWGPADNEIAAWARQGKKFVLIVRYIKEGGSEGNCGSSQYLPGWEIARIQNFCDRDTGSIIPDYFDPTFKADLKAFVRAIATHYANSPYRSNLLYVRIGLGEGGEGFPISPRGDYYTIDRQQLASWGYTPINWINWQKEMLLSYKSSFSYAPVIYPLNGQDTDPTTGQPIQVEVAKWAAANGFGVGQQGLQPGTDSPIFQQLRSQYPKMYIQYQTIGVVRSFRGIQADIQAANENGAQFIEWYSQNAVNPNFQSLFVHWQQVVDNKFG